MKAAIDRFEGDQAVLVLEGGEKTLVVPKKALPRGARAGHWLQIELEGKELKSASIDREETKRAKKRIAKLLDDLRKGKHLE